jgi:hypothetical protein
MARVLLLIAAVICFSGCSTHIGQFSALATGTFRGENIDGKHLVKSNTEGSSCRTWFLMLPLGAAPKVDQAVSEILSQMNGDIITNARLYETGWSILLFSRGCYKLEGDVYRTI